MKMQWQPIDTAPRDGTEIDVWEYCHDPKWRPREHGIEHGMRLTNVRWGKDGWEHLMDGMRGWGFYRCDDNPYYTISHWLPILGPPQ
jgi:hypothetical protein